MEKHECYSGVYMIHCNRNGKVYIGSAEDIKEREWGHKSNLRSKAEEASRLLQEDWDLYGEDCFTFSTIERCDFIDLVDREDYWVRFFKSTKEHRGYNILFPKSKKLDREEGGNKSYHYYKQCPLMVINKSTGVATECQNNLRAAELTGISENRIVEYYRYWEGVKTRGTSCHGYIFVRKLVYDPEFDYINFKPSYRRGRVAKPKPEKVLKAIEDYNVKRVAVIAEHCATGEQRRFNSRKQCCQLLDVVPSKLDKCLKAEFKKYKTHDHYFKLA